MLGYRIHKLVRTRRRTGTGVIRLGQWFTFEIPPDPKLNDNTMIFYRRVIKIDRLLPRVSFPARHRLLLGLSRAMDRRFINSRRLLCLGYGDTTDYVYRQLFVVRAGPSLARS